MTLSDLGRMLLSAEETSQGKVIYMTRNAYFVGLALLTVFASNAVVASSALAVEFLLNGVALKPGEPLAVETEGELLLEDTKAAGGKVDVTCHGTLLGGIEPTLILVDHVEGSEGKLSLFKAKEAIECAFGAEHGLCLEGTVPALTPVKMDWNLELVLLGMVPTLSLLVKKDPGFEETSGNPGWSVDCTNILGGLTADECTGETGLELKNTLAGLEGKFLGAENEEISPPGTCTVGGEKAGLVQSLSGGIITPTGGGFLSV